MNAPSDEEVRSFFRRWSSLQDEKERITEDAKELFAEAKALGYNTKAMRVAFSRKRKLDDEPEAVREAEQEIDLYLACLESGTHRATRAHRAEGIASPAPATPPARAQESRETGVVVDAPVEARAPAVMTPRSETAAHSRPADEDIPEFLRRVAPVRGIA
jgi:uncharacterized protein (UPF0335 family)